MVNGPIFKHGLKGMTWFNQDKIGGTYDLRLATPSGPTALGQKYLEKCTAWVEDVQR